jgi:hypothetical protein
MAIGLIAFFVTEELTGGLTGMQGFFAGFIVVIIVYFVLGVLESRRVPQTDSRIAGLSSSGNISITQTESDNGVAIHIYVNGGINRQSQIDLSRPAQTPISREPRYGASSLSE